MLTLFCILIAPLKEIAVLMTAEMNTPEGDRLEVLATLVEAYETKHFPVELADPIDPSRSRWNKKA